MIADTAQADAFANGQRQVREADRVALVAALHLPPETTWADALARVVPVVAGAKGCHGCDHDLNGFCGAMFVGQPHRDTVRAWSNAYLKDDRMTPNPGAPECPGRVPKEQP